MTANDQTHISSRRAPQPQSGRACPLPFIGRALAASGKIVAGMEAGRPTTHSTRSTLPSSPRPPASRSSSSRSRTTTSASSSCSTRCRAPADSTSTSPTRYGCRSSTRRASSRTFPGIVTDADRSDFSKTAIETVTYQGALVALPIMVHNCAMYYRTDLFEKAGLKAPPASWDEYLRFRQEDDRRAGRHLGHADRQQAGHRGLDPAALVLPAGGRRPAGRRRQADHQLGCRPRRARVHDQDGVRGQGSAGGRAGTYRHAGHVAGGQAGHGAGLAVSLLAQQGAAGRQVRDRHRAGPREPRRHGLLLGLCRGERRQEPGRRDRVHQVGDRAPTCSMPSARSG